MQHIGSTGEDGDQLEFSVTVNGSVNWHNHFGDKLAIMKQSWGCTDPTTQQFFTMASK